MTHPETPPLLSKSAKGTYWKYNIAVYCIATTGYENTTQNTLKLGVDMGIFLHLLVGPFGLLRTDQLAISQNFRLHSVQKLWHLDSHIWTRRRSSVLRFPREWNLYGTSYLLYLTRFLCSGEASGYPTSDLHCSARKVVEVVCTSCLYCLA
jgi:hypothetical protein